MLLSFFPLYRQTTCLYMSRFGALNHVLEGNKLNIENNIGAALRTPTKPGRPSPVAFPIQMATV